MGTRILVRPGLGGGGALAAPALSLNKNRDTLSGTLGAVAGAVAYRARYREQADRPVGGAYDGFTWEILVPNTKLLTFSMAGALWPNTAYDVQVAAIDILDNIGPWTTVQITADPFLLPRLVRDNADLTQTRSWNWDSSAPGGVGTVQRMNSGSSDNNGPYTRVTFTAASQSFFQYVPLQSMTGRAMTVRIKVRSTDGSTKNLGVYLHDSDGNNYYDFPTNGSPSKNVQVTGAWTEIVLPRPAFTGANRRMKLGLNSYNGNAVSSFDIEYLDAVDSSSPAAAAAVVKTTGDTLQEPWTGVGSSDPANPLVLTSHHLSTDPNIPAVDQTGGALWYQGHASGPGDIVRCITGYPTYTATTNARLRGVRPTVAGKYQGKAVRTAYSSGTVTENTFIRGGNGILIQNRRPMPTIASGIFSQGNFRTRYNRSRDQDGRLSDGAGSFIKSNYSNIQNRPPGAPLGYMVANFIQMAGQTTDTGETIPPITEWNEFSGRPGFSLVEDGMSHIQIRGTGVGYPVDTGLPYKVNRNLGAFAQLGWDFNWHAANDATRPYSYSGVLTTFPLALTVGSAGAAQGTNQIVLSNRLYLNVGTVAAGTVLTFTGGKSATVRNAINSGTAVNGQGVSVIDVQPLAAALNAGDVATIANFQDHPGPYSGTLNMLADGYAGNTGDVGNAEVQSRYGQAFGNISLGPSGIHATCAGRDLTHIGPEVFNTPTMIDGVVPHDGTRTGYGFVCTFGETTRRSRNAQGAYVNVWGANSIVGMIGSGVAVADGRTYLSGALSAGATTANVTVGLTDPIPAGAQVIFRNSAGGQVGTATVGSAGASAGALSIPITGLSGAVASGNRMEFVAGDSFKPLLTRENVTAPASQNTYPNAMRRWQAWRDTAAAQGYTIGPVN